MEAWILYNYKGKEVIPSNTCFPHLFPFMYCSFLVYYNVVGWV